MKKNNKKNEKDIITEKKELNEESLVTKNVSSDDNLEKEDSIAIGEEPKDIMENTELKEKEVADELENNVATEEVITESIEDEKEKTVELETKQKVEENETEFKEDTNDIIVKDEEEIVNNINTEGKEEEDIQVIIPTKEEQNETLELNEDKTRITDKKEWKIKELTEDSFINTLQNIKEDGLIYDPQIISELIYFYYQAINKKNSNINLDTIIGELDSSICQIAFYFAIKKAVNNQIIKLAQKIHNDMSKRYKKGIIVEISEIVINDKVENFLVTKCSKKSSKTIIKLYKRLNKLEEYEKDFLIPIYYDFIVFPTKYNNKVFEKICSLYTRKKMNFEFYQKKNIAYGYLYRRKYNNALKLFTELTEEWPDKFELKVLIMIAKHRGISVEELVLDNKKVRKFKEYKELKRQASENEEITQKLEALDGEIKKYEKDNKYEDLKYTRKVVFSISLIATLFLGVLAYFIGNSTIKILAIIAACVVGLSSFVTNDIKRSLKNIIVKMLIAIILIVMIIILIK